MGFITDILGLVLGFVQNNILLIVIAVIVFAIFKSHLFEKIAETVGKPAGAAFLFAIVLVAAVSINPSLLSFTTDLIAGPNQQVRQAKAELLVMAIDPSNKPSEMINPVAKAAADSIQTEYELKTAKNMTGISAEEAERACRQPKSERSSKWGNEDPCEYTASPLARIVAKNLDKVDATETKLLQPVGTPAQGSPDWVKAMYQIPRAVLYMLFAIATMLVLLSVVRALFKALSR